VGDKRLDVARDRFADHRQGLLADQGKDGPPASLRERGANAAKAKSGRARFYDFGAGDDAPGRAPSQHPVSLMRD
jgi:hypothetical protein